MKKIPKYKFYFIVFDFLIIALAFQITALFVWKTNNLSFAYFFKPFLDISILFAFVSIIFILTFQYNNLYKINVILNKASHLTALIKSLFFGALTIIVLSFMFKYFEILYSRLTLFTFSIILLILLFIVRVEILRNIYMKLRNKQFKRNFIIVGAGKAGKLLATKIILEDSMGINIIGFVDDNKTIGKEIVADKKVLGTINQVQDIIRENKIDEILVVMDNVSYDRLLEIVDTCKQLEVNVRLTSELFDIVTKKVSTEKYSDFPVVDVSSRVNKKFSLAFKRSFDVLGAVIGLVILSPIFLTIALLIKLSSPGPIFFYQERIGRNGKAFKFYKFRSMYVNDGEDEERKSMMLDFINDNSTGNGKKVINESRITEIGKIIRKTSLDELPQLFNVIKGDMSLVGPRPCLPYEYENYANWQKRRVNVLPGCTGVWQVTGRSAVSFKDSIVLDLYYINNMSPWLDLQILLKTVPVMLFARGGK
jgi:exopolysaccharide biosynthesis polyprenyl glycosylphosphotransferase